MLQRHQEALSRAVQYQAQLSAEGATCSLGRRDTASIFRMMANLFELYDENSSLALEPAEIVSLLRSFFKEGERTIRSRKVTAMLCGMLCGMLRSSRGRVACV